KALERERYLGITGCIFSELREFHLEQSLDKIRAKHFPEWPREAVNFQRTDIMNCRGPFAKLRDPAARREFDWDLQRMLYRLPFRIITVAIDKRAHTDHYVSAKEAYHYCAEVLLERYCLYVKSQNAVGDVVVEARGKAEDSKLSDVWC